MATVTSENWNEILDKERNVWPKILSRLVSNHADCIQPIINRRQFRLHTFEILQKHPSLIPCIENHYSFQQYADVLKQ